MGYQKKFQARSKKVRTKYDIAKNKSIIDKVNLDLDYSLKDLIAI